MIQTGKNPEIKKGVLIILELDYLTCNTSTQYYQFERLWVCRIPTCDLMSDLGKHHFKELNKPKSQADKKLLTILLVHQVMRERLCSIKLTFPWLVLK